MPKRQGTPRASVRRSRTRLPAFPVAYVRYHDHCWLDATELAKIREAEPYVVEETGFLLVETPQYVTLAKERSTDGEKGKVRYGDVTIIMRSDILDFEILGTPKGNGREGVPRRAGRNGRNGASGNGHRSTTRPQRA